jgi:uncharacterized membrane protein
MFGALLSLASAAFFGLNNATLRRGVIKGSVLQAMAITVPFGVPMFLIIAYFMGGFKAMASWGVAPWIWMILAGLVHFVIGRYGNYKATQLLGSTLSTPIQQLSIVLSLGLAVIFLGETVNLMNIIGIALVVVGPMIVVRRNKASTKPVASKAFTPNYGPFLGRSLCFWIWDQPAICRPWDRRWRYSGQRRGLTGVLRRSNDCCVLVGYCRTAN